MSHVRLHLLKRKGWSPREEEEDKHFEKGVNKSLLITNSRVLMFASETPKELSKIHMVPNTNGFKAVDASLLRMAPMDQKWSPKTCVN
ncbi:unnamed protein product [Sphenostylis stenocarpa]|uniref:Uncharacterized protein n=1 Tax=Sphenostylis stenocarpa TaxID=92480 RepID=A0AA86W2X0_9FABA|nr:unnamed protein product [Sphenostylis stenocarpa]